MVRRVCYTALSNVLLLSLGCESCRRSGYRFLAIVSLVFSYQSLVLRYIRRRTDVKQDPTMMCDVVLYTGMYRYRRYCNKQS